MKSSIIYLLVFISLFACKKENIEYINHDSEIFTGDDSLIYGNWEYLYTIDYGGWRGGSMKTNQNRSPINIKPIDNYESLQGEHIISTGKIDTVGHDYNNNLKVIFYPNGIKVQNPITDPIILDAISPLTIYTLHNDTLVMSVAYGYDIIVIEDYYIRIKYNIIP